MLKTFDPTAPTFGADRSAIFRQLRDQHQVFHDEPTDTYFPIWFDDVFEPATEVIGRLLGVPADRLETFRHLIDQLSRSGSTP
ncbi:Uncharacterised protein [Mycolicibacterium vanbaalenii]|uniref:Uncharacterized protein n=1 Tax=Mycolicibacterium vanbaalenii TaxID=110539 RepID=A0A5S9QZ49_MYCVN|nr:hypothetical protein [Mycolicibacterium vanbaalenii]CAA0124561.1 Uncharacterised protein [Mycolicibacterium vanbaalenii]